MVRHRQNLLSSPYPPPSMSVLSAKDRQDSTVPPPYWSELSQAELMDTDGRLCIMNILLHFLRQGRLSKQHALDIGRHATQVLRAEQNMLTLRDPITIVGDLNGQLYDLAKIFYMNGSPEENQYLFLGNYSGGGGFSCECLLFLLAAKINYPNSVFLLRGCHESRFMTEVLLLDQECERKYSRQMYSVFLQVFNSLPLAATVSERYFCVHGGLSPDVSRLEDIQLIHRHREVPTKGAMCDLLWSDPYWDVDNPATTSSGGQTEYYTPGTGSYQIDPRFLDNEQRGCSYLFNFACVKHFESLNKLFCIIRSHGVQDQGYKLYRADPNNNFPCLISVFSAPNYCNTFDNKGAVLRIARNGFHIKQFYCSPHPYVLPEMNAFSWSMPFVINSLHNFFSTVFVETGSPKDRNPLAFLVEDE